ncbi:MAG: carbohydrate kinase family protein [Betaproteobacteria bacterium]|nr:carbohydrate kinase family protein [Betaproteobacteria bacterium]
MSVLICGSLAFDTIMVFPDRFREHILPDKLHMLNVAFLVPEMRREYGGTAGNIAYNLHGLGGDARIMATVGDDFGPYRERLQTLGLRTDHVRHVPGSYTAQAFITTDLDDNQITAFHPGAMNFSHDNSVFDAGDLKLGVIAPDGRDGMFRHARSQIWAEGRVYEIPAVAPTAVVDPTGCGDAYRAGLLYGMVNGLDWDTTGRLASLLGALKIAERGAQNHPVVRSDIEDRFAAAFGRSLAG